jgi:hypothetical protein
MASPSVDNVIDLSHARDLRRRRNHSIEINWYTFTPMIGFAMWVGMIYGAYWIWHHA